MDPSRLAADVRTLGFLAHRTLQSPSPDPNRLRDLANRISRLRANLGDTLTSPLGQWVSNVEDTIQRHASTPSGGTEAGPRERLRGERRRADFIRA
jgi:hypothetical protein